MRHMPWLAINQSSNRISRPIAPYIAQRIKGE